MRERGGLRKKERGGDRMKDRGREIEGERKKKGEIGRGKDIVGEIKTDRMRERR